MERLLTSNSSPETLKSLFVNAEVISASSEPAPTFGRPVIVASTFMLPLLKKYCRCIISDEVSKNKKKDF